MTLSTQYSKVELTANGRALYDGKRNSDGGLNLDVVLIGSLGGGSASVQVSYHDPADIAIDAQWQNLFGATELVTDTVYPVAARSRPALCVRLTGATSPTLTVLFS